MGAYGVGPHQIVGGPDWLTSSAFEISAKAETPDSGDAELMVMLQALLADRFKLVLHRENRVMPAFVLEVDKNGPKLEKATAPGESETNTSGSNAGVVISARYIDSRTAWLAATHTADSGGSAGGGPGGETVGELKAPQSPLIQWEPAAAAVADKGVSDTSRTELQASPPATVPVTVSTLFHQLLLAGSWTPPVTG